MTQTNTRNGALAIPGGALATRETAMSIAIATYSNPQILSVIKDQICPGATPPEMWQFLARCVSLGLDPFSRQIYFIKRQGKVSHQIGIDGFRSIAEDTGELVEISEPEYEGETDMGDGKHAPVLARVTVVREIRGRDRSFTGVARWQEFCPGPPNDFMWKKMPFHMLGKCAEAQAMRRAFPQRMGGLQTDAEALGAEEVFAASASMRGSAAAAAPTFIEVTDERTGEVRQIRAGDEFVRLYGDGSDDGSSSPQPVAVETASPNHPMESEPVATAEPTRAEPDPEGIAPLDYEQCYELWEASGHVSYRKPPQTKDSEMLRQWLAGFQAKLKEAPAMT